MVFVLLAEYLLRLQGNYYSWTEQNGLGTVTPFDFDDTYKCWIHYNNDCDTVNVTESFSHSQSFNSELIRDVEHPKEKPKKEYRIIFLGDSFTEGYGVEFDKIWHQHLSKSLNGQLANVTVRCISGGVAGSDPFLLITFSKKNWSIMLLTL